MDGVTGSLEVRVEGRPVLVLTDIDFGSAPVAQVAIYNRPNSFSTGVLMYFLDYIVWDGSGTRNNDFIGTALVGPLITDADVALNWTPVGAATGAAILPIVPPDDAKYISAATPPPPAYVASLTDLPDDVTSVYALLTIVRAAKDDGGDAGFQVGLISDPDGVPATVEGADRPITVVPTYWSDVFEVDPKTSTSWTPTAVDKVQLKLNRTS